MVQDVLLEAVRSQRKSECVVADSSKPALHSDSYSEQVQYCKSKPGRDKEETHKQMLYLCKLLSSLQGKKISCLKCC